MKKVIAAILVVTLLNSCGIRFGDFHRWQEVHGDKNCNKK